MSDDATLDRWWSNNALPLFAHIEYDHANMASRLPTVWRSTWLDRFCAERSGCNGKRFAEYGIGGGLLGVMLLGDSSTARAFCSKNKGGKLSEAAKKWALSCNATKLGHFEAAHYAGIDISQRQREGTRGRLSFLFDSSRFSVHDTSVDFRSLGVDYFISQAVIMHFPSLAYTDDWLARVNTCGAERLMLNVRMPAARQGPCCNRNLSFSSSTSHGAVRHATTVDTPYLQARLPRYRLDWHEDVQAAFRFHVFSISA